MPNRCYVWECMGEPGYFGLNTDPQYRPFQTPNWMPRGELSRVRELSEWTRRPGDLINGWHNVVRLNRDGTLGERFATGHWPGGLP
jgi:hypothetical protein